MGRKMTNNNNEKLWTIEEVADFLQVKPSVIKYWIYNSEIPYIKLGKHYRFDHADIKDWIDCRKERQNHINTDLRLIE